jgi:hypothetical protein
MYGVVRQQQPVPFHMPGPFQNIMANNGSTVKPDLRTDKNAKKRRGSYKTRGGRGYIEARTEGSTLSETKHFLGANSRNRWQKQFPKSSPTSRAADDVQDFNSYTPRTPFSAARKTSKSKGAQFDVGMSKQECIAFGEDLKKDRRRDGQNGQKANDNEVDKKQKQNEARSEAQHGSSLSTRGKSREDINKVNLQRVSRDLSLQSEVTCQDPQQHMRFFSRRPQTPNIQITNVHSNHELLSPATLTSPPSPRRHMAEMLEQRTSQSLISQPPSLAARNADVIDIFLDNNDFTDLEGDPARQDKERKKLRALRVESFKRRGEERTKRRQLRRLESTKIKADAAFMKFVTKKMAQPPVSSQSYLKQSGDLISDLNPYYVAMQAARNEYGDLEDDYNQLAESLDDFEFKLAQAESRVYKTPQGDTDLLANSTDTGDLSWDEKSDTSWADEHAYHPLHAKLLDKLGDLDLATERLNYWKQKLDQDQWTLQYGAHLEHENKGGLEKLNAGVKELRDRLEGVKNERSRIFYEVELLRARCEEEGIYLQIYSPMAEDFSEDIDALQVDKDSQMNTSPSGRAKESEAHIFTSLFPTLVDKKQDLKAMINEIDEIDLTKTSKFPTFLDKQADLDIFITQFDEDNKNDRINRWLFYGLRVSPLAIDLLAQIILDRMIIDLNKINTENIQHLVASTWFSDEANYLADQFIQPNSQTCETHGHYLHSVPT